MKHVLLGAALVAGMVVPAAAQQISLGRFLVPAKTLEQTQQHLLAKRALSNL